MVEVIDSKALTETDPLVLLMDDRLAFEQGQKIGGAHPHAGLETVTSTVPFASAMKTPCSLAAFHPTRPNQGG